MNPICLRLPVSSYKFCDEPNPTPTPDKATKSPLTDEQKVEAFKEANPKAFAIVFGRGIVKGKKSVTDDHLQRAEDDRYDKLRGSLVTEKIHRKIRSAAKVANAIDPEDCVDLLSLKFDLGNNLQVIKAGSDGNSVEVDLAVAVKELAVSRPHLFKSTQKAGHGSVNQPRGVNDISNTSKPTFKRSQLQDSDFYAKHQAEIELAQREGRITDDTNQA